MGRQQGGGLLERFTVGFSALLLLLLLSLLGSEITLANKEQCYLDCGASPTVGLNASLNGTLTLEDTQRLVGPTRPDFTAEYPYAKAGFPINTTHFCGLGCAYFFGGAPTNNSCKALCDIAYAHNTSVGFSDITEKARLECRDGCDIGMMRCQPGYFCSDTAMLECPAGTYRNTSYISVSSCIDCPRGTYRERTKGRGVLDCELCPKGTYQNTTGSKSSKDCIRCPDGYYGDEEGLGVCKCITEDSCEADWQQWQRESEPFIGRW